MESSGQNQGIVAGLSHFGILVFDGADAESFLQGQLSCDVKGITRDSATWGSYCTAKGRVLADFFLWRKDTAFLMLLPRDLIAVIRKRLSMFVLRSKVTVADATEKLSLLGCSGTGTLDTLRRLFDGMPTSPRGIVSNSDGSMLIEIEPGRFLCVLPTEKAEATVRELSGTLQQEDEKIWRWLDIRGGIPWITTATQEQFVPQMVNLDLIDGISFSKGCYPGQEIVARTRYLGKVKRRMFLANVAEIATAGDPLFGEDLGNQASGMVVNAEASPEGGFDLLAVIQTESREKSSVHLRSLDGPVLRFLPLPYSVT